MKKIMPFITRLALCALLNALMACSYHALEPQTEVPPPSSLAQPASDKEDPEATSDQELKEEDTASVASADDSSDKQTENENAEANSALMTEQELQAVSGSKSLQRTQTDAMAVQQSEADSIDEEEKTRKKEVQPGQSSASDIVRQERRQNDEHSSSAEQAYAAQEESVSEADSDDTKQAQDADFQWLPEELDDGSAGELSNSPEKPLVSDEATSGNSNINRKGRDTYLMEDGKPKRFWNLQRQL